MSEIKRIGFFYSALDLLPTIQAIEEETIPGYVAGRYYPTRIGEMLKDRY
jgi:hypothetical protein